jgi:hypothetical protein
LYVKKFALDQYKYVVLEQKNRNGKTGNQDRIGTEKMFRGLIMPQKLLTIKEQELNRWTDLNKISTTTKQPLREHSRKMLACLQLRN